MSIRRELERFETLDEHGKTVFVTKVRNFERITKLDGQVEEIEKLPDLSVGGSVVGGIDDPPYQYQIIQTGMKLRDKK